jgi:hypothetical protein
VLLSQITIRGYTGGYKVPARHLRPLRCAEATELAAPAALGGRPAVRQVTGWITGLPGRLDPEDAEDLHQIRSRCPELAAAVRYIAGFARMIKDLSGDRDTLTAWMNAVDAELPPLRSFTAGLRRDLDAVVAGLTLGYNSRRGRGHRQPHQTAQGRDVRTRETRPAPQTHTPCIRSLALSRESERHRNTFLDNSIPASGMTLVDTDGLGSLKSRRSVRRFTQCVPEPDNSTIHISVGQSPTTGTVRITFVVSDRRSD